MRNKLLSFSTFIFILSFLAFLSPMTAQAAPQSICVSSPGGGDWAAPTTWLFCAGGVPGPADDVAIQGGAPVVISAPASAANVTISGPGFLDLEANLSANSLTIDPFGVFTCGTNSITLQGNFTNSGLFVCPSGTVIFSGSTQNLAANSVTTFNNLTVNSGAILVETVSADNVLVSGSLTNNGVIRKSQNIPGTGIYTFGLAGGPVNGANVGIQVTTDNFVNITLDRISQNHPQRTGAGAPPLPGVGWERYWHIAAIGSGTANVTLPHSAPDDSLTQACRYITGAGAGWDCSRSSSTSNTVTRAGVNAFSDWAVGYSVNPTAVNLSRLEARPAGMGTAEASGLLGLALLVCTSIILVTKKAMILAARSNRGS